MERGIRSSPLRRRERTCHAFRPGMALMKAALSRAASFTPQPKSCARAWAPCTCVRDLDEYAAHKPVLAETFARTHGAAEKRDAQVCGKHIEAVALSDGCGELHNRRS
jgi:hypothetical protein